MHAGHSYNQKQTTINSIHSRCTNYYRLKCPAILKTKNETVIETKGSRNHDCDLGEWEANETEKTYNKTIELMSEETNPNPGEKLAVFKKAVLNDFSKNFPHAEISCCDFHEVMQKFKYLQKNCGIIALQTPLLRKN